MGPSPEQQARAERVPASLRPKQDLVITSEDPRTEDVRALITVHLAGAHELSPPEHVHALGLTGLLDPAVTFFGARRAGVLVGMGALKELDPAHAEVKSMHTLAAERGRGVGRAMVAHLLGVASERGYQRVSLETGATEAFARAHALYASVGFERCAPFADYTDNPYSTCMTLLLEQDRA